jgi:DNA polymerase III subunit delta
MFIVLHGPNEFGAHEELDRLRAEKDPANYSTDLFRGGESSLEAILASCDTLPFLSELRLVIVVGLPKKRRGGTEAGVANPPDPAGAEDDALSPAASPLEPAGKPGVRKRKSPAPMLDARAFTEALAQHVPHMPDSTVLVVVTDELLDVASPLVKAAKSQGWVQSFTPPRGAELEAWLIQRARAAGSDLARPAAHTLAILGGDNLRALAGEIEKLSTYVGPGGHIGVEEVRALTLTTSQARIFDLTDALCRRDQKRGLAVLHELLDSGESPLGIVALTAIQTRSLIQVKSLSERGMRIPLISQTAGVAPFVVEKLLPLARHFSFVQLEATHRRLQDVDRALKRSKMTPELALDLLVIEFGTIVADDG